MPNLTTAIVRCRASAWLNGDHLRIPAMLAPIIAAPSVPAHEYGEQPYNRFDT
jgi:hypothetical protein